MIHLRNPRQESHKGTGAQTANSARWTWGELDLLQKNVRTTVLKTRLPSVSLRLCGVLVRTACVLVVAALAQAASADAPRVLPAGTLPADSRLEPLKDLNGYFPFTPPTDKDAWAKRADYVRRQILVSQGLWPMPTKTPLNAVIHGSIDCGDYTVEKVYFESVPGLFVTGNLYRPKGSTGIGAPPLKYPAVMFAHGHWKDARLSEESEANVRKEIATGQERFEKGGRSRFQSMCVQLARMGCIVWQWDMLSDSDAIQFSAQTVHRFAKQRPEFNTLENWGLYSAQAEARLQSIMGLQTLNAVRSLDFLMTLPEIDPKRIAITGASGGGTQTMLLAAIDPRITLSFPAVMVSTAMQGGCTCESSSLLRVNTGNIEFAGLFAPKPQGMTTANDWTKEMSTKGFPELQQLYKFLGAPNNVMLHRGEHFPHNYNAVSRSAFYTLLNKHFKLGFPEPVIEKDFEPLTRAQLTVWDDKHPAPKADDADFERKLLKWLADDADKQLRSAAASLEGLKKEIAPAVEVLIGRSIATAGKGEWELKLKTDRGDYIEMNGLLRNKTYKEELPVVWLFPKDWDGHAVVWLGDGGKSSLYTADGKVQPDVLRLVKSGATVLGIDLLMQGEFLAEGQPLKETRKVANPREFAGYTFGYNHALFAQRTHDVLTAVSFLRTAEYGSHPKVTRVDVVGLGGTGPIVAAARAIAGGQIDRAAVDTGGFRFGKLLDYRDPQFLPGGAKYLDVPGLLALSAPHPLWLAGEGNGVDLVTAAYAPDGNASRLTLAPVDKARAAASATDWLLKQGI
ncbi:alpha/beta hydrolase family protein [Humisphaera borealis]|uniref:Acetylxylan esterase n=1 Tax=Humisphaera borealis TaxID=2807512 RepID=A0A7M2WY26_9BACT|nr:acetylxylan esterase [Humisphaera borealis]QOV89711.1 acetylxylan esterase [Humisphaera borealis]